MKFTVEYKKLVDFQVTDMSEECATLTQAKEKAHSVTMQGDALGHAYVFITPSNGFKQRVAMFGSQHAV